MTGTTRYLLAAFFATAVCAGCEGRIEATDGDATTEEDTAAADTTPPSDTDEGDAADTGTTPTDTGDDVHDTTCEKTYPRVDPAATAVAGQLDDALRIDGALDEPAYDHLPALRVADDSGESDNEMAVRVGWTGDAIYLAFEVTDAEIEYDPELSLHQNDGVEVFFDTDNDGGPDMSADDRHWIIPAKEAEPLTERGSSSGDEPKTDTELDVAITHADDGYVMEMSAPLADLDLAPSDGGAVGFLVANNDLASGRHTAFAWRGVESFKRVDEWGELLFASPTCDTGGDTGIVTDAGDTGETGDADGGDAVDGGSSCPAAGDYEPTPVSGPANIGGGPDYANTVCRSEADTVVSSKSELENALANAGSGDVVFVTPNSEFDMGFDARLTVPSGVTLSGGRGCNCRAGALLYTDSIVKDDYDHETMLVAESDARVTGLRVRGPRNERNWATLDEQDHYWDGSGVDAEGGDVEIDNNEIWGFAHAGVSGNARTHVHHNFIHTMPRDGLGYGVNGGDEVLIEYNYFEFVRHAVANGGTRSYTARYNHMGTHAISHVFDMHKSGGGTVEIHHNTVEAVDNDIKNKKVPAVTIRGTPSDTADIHHNWLYNPESPCFSNDNWPDCAIVQMHVTSWSNVDFWDNHYGSSDPGDCDIGAPREGC